MRFNLFCLLFILYLPGFTQDIQQENIINNIEIDENTEEQFNEQLEKHQEYQIQSINLTFATPQELSNSGLFNINQINAITQHQKETGKIIDLYELQILPEFSENDLVILAKYCVHLTEINYQKPSTFSTSRIKFTNQTPINSGSPCSIYYKISHKNSTGISWMLAMEQDVAEQFHFNGIQFPLDHLCGNLYFTKRNFNIIIGSYRSFLGQGLLMGQGKGTEFAADWTTLIATNNGFSPYASAMEFGYQNGIAIRYDHRNWKIFFAPSYQKIDSGSNSGLHRTITEIRHQKQIKQSVLNARIAYQFNHAELGINTIIDIYNANQGYSFDLVSHYQNMIIGAEIADFNNKTAIHLACMSILNKQTSIAIAYNSFSSNYQNTFASNQLLQGNSSNDMGFSIALKKAINSKSFFQIISNSHLIEAAEKTIKSPQLMNKIQGVLIFTARSGNEIQYKSSYQFQNKKITTSVETIELYEYQAMLSNTLVIKNHITKELQLLNRIDFKTNTNSNSAAYQCAIKYALIDLKINFGYGITFYKCDFETRIYSAEQQLPNSLSSVILNGDGIRGYFYLQSKINKHCTLSLKTSKNKVLAEKESNSYAFQLVVK